MAFAIAILVWRSFEPALRKSCALQNKVGIICQIWQYHNHNRGHHYQFVVVFVVIIIVVVIVIIIVLAVIIVLIAVIVVVVSIVIIVVIFITIIVIRVEKISVAKVMSETGNLPERFFCCCFFFPLLCVQKMATVFLW
jgi:hypothetical protein